MLLPMKFYSLGGLRLVEYKPYCPGKGLSMYRTWQFTVTHLFLQLLLLGYHYTNINTPAGGVRVKDKVLSIIRVNKLNVKNFLAFSRINFALKLFSRIFSI